MTKVKAGLNSGEASLPDLRTAAFFLSPHTALPPHTCKERVMSGVSSSSCKDTSTIKLETHSDNLI